MWKGNLMKKVVYLGILWAVLGALSLSPAVAEGNEATYIVNTFGTDDDYDPYDTICMTRSGNCSLRAAIQQSNADGVPSIIKFDYHYQITDSSLPIITADNTTIDASDQYQYGYNQPGIEITSSYFGYSVLRLDSRENKIFGILFRQPNGTCIEIRGHLNEIGGIGNKRNIFLCNTGIAIADGRYNQVSNNYFGTIDGEVIAQAGGTGINIASPDNTIQNNLIGFQNCGIFINSTGTKVKDNLIGISATKNGGIPNSRGIEIWENSNTIGPNNLIDMNIGEGIYIFSADWNKIIQNKIGSSSPGGGNGKEGIRLAYSTDNQVGLADQGNEIVGNKSHGISVVFGSDYMYSNKIRGNAIHDNIMDGIYLENSSGQLGGAETGEGNAIYLNKRNGIHLNNADNWVIQGNKIGVYGGNSGHGILIENGSQSNNVGGDSPAKGNWISNNLEEGIKLDKPGTSANRIENNLIGLSQNLSSRAGNWHHGVSIYGGATNNYIGTAARGNTILASGWNGIGIYDSNSNYVVSNNIGVYPGLQGLGNSDYGITIFNSSFTMVFANEIAYNGNIPGEAGIQVFGDSSDSNLLTVNSIHDHPGKGIALDNGGNNNLPAPLITQATCTLVSGTACAGCSVKLFSDAGNEGRYYLGSTTANPATQAFSWSGFVLGPNVTALAVDDSNNTSEFGVKQNACFSYFLPITIK